MMSNVGLNIYQLRILIRILRNNVGAIVFEDEKIMKSLSGDMLIPKFGEYNCYHKTGSKSELILLLVGDIVYKKEIQLLINSSDIDTYEITRIDIVIGGEHGQGAFRFAMKILYIINTDKRH